MLTVSNSPTLSGNTGKTDAKGYDVYRLKAIHELLTNKEGGTKLSTEEDCRMAMVLIALLAGGDYVPEGLDQFGQLGHTSQNQKLTCRTDYRVCFGSCGLLGDSQAIYYRPREVPHRNESYL